MRRCGRKACNLAGEAQISAVGAVYEQKMLQTTCVQNMQHRIQGLSGGYPTLSRAKMAVLQE